VDPEAAGRASREIEGSDEVTILTVSAAIQLRGDDECPTPARRIYLDRTVKYPVATVDADAGVSP
jgi:hypothetical protein